MEKAPYFHGYKRSRFNCYVALANSWEAVEPQPDGNAFSTRYPSGRAITPCRTEQLPKLIKRAR